MPEYLVLVADQGRARTFTREQKFSELVEDQSIEHVQGRLHVSDLVTHQQGTGHSRSGSGSDAMGNPDDIKASEARKFAQKVVDLLRRRQLQAGCSRIIVAAAPRFLGQLRSAMKKSFNGSVILELDKDLTQEEPGRIRRIIDEAMVA